MRCLLLISLLWACDSDTDATEADASVDNDAMTSDSTTPDPEDGAVEADAGADVGSTEALTYTPCSRETHVGGFVVDLTAEFTAVQGQVAAGVDPSRVPMVAAEDGPCELLRPATHFCEEGCDPGFTCGPDGCVERPSNVGLGVVRVSGLKAPVEMEANPPVFFYTHRGDLDHPGYELGANIGLEVEGGEHAAFGLRGEGVEALVLEGEVPVIDRGVPALVQWTPPSVETTAMVELELSIANHGGTPGQIDCLVPDNGSFEFPASLIEALLDSGFSGFPAVAMTRRTVEAVDTELGCIEFSVRSALSQAVEIPGLVSCSADEDCPEDQRCQPDLSCG